MIKTSKRHPLRQVLLAGAALSLLTACDKGLDWDLRDIGGSRSTLDTSQSVAQLPDRPRPDSRGVISYPTYQVVVAQRGDTINTIAARLGVDANALARHNGIQADSPLRRDELIALPTRVSEPTQASGATPLGNGDVISGAAAAINRAGDVRTTALPSATPASPTTPVIQTGSEPIRHQVQRGETAYSIARLYNVPVRTVAEWNGLGADLSVRDGQQLLIPVAGSTAPPPATSTTAPGQGSATPVPPSSTTPLPQQNATPAAPATPTPAPASAPAIQAPAAPANAASARLASPVSGSIIRAYNPPRNEGVDFGVAAGTAVKAADAGTVAAVTKDTNGVAIVVIRHSGNLLTVYTNLDNLTVERGSTVTRGQTIGKVKAGNPSFLHFEVRQGTTSVDPADYLP